MKSEDGFIIYMDQKHIEVYVRPWQVRESSAGKDDPTWPFCLERCNVG